MSKFKVGDRVVPISTNLPKFQNKYLNTIITITRVEDSWCPENPLYHWDNPERLGFREDSLISEELFNSPLYQALL